MSSVVDFGNVTTVRCWRLSQLQKRIRFWASAQELIDLHVKAGVSQKRLNKCLCFFVLRGVCHRSFRGE